MSIGDHGAVSAQTAHPLDPLTAEEVEGAAAVVRARDASPELMFATIALREPDKDDVHAVDAGSSPVVPRRAVATCYRPATRTTVEAEVDLTAGAIVRWDELPDTKPIYLEGDATRVQAAVRADERWLAALRARGIDDPDQVQLDPWNGGHLGSEHDDRGHRTARVLCYLRPTPDHNPYARPIDGLLVVADFDTGEILEVIDRGTARIPPDGGRFGASRMLPDREVAALEIAQPAGPGFEVSGNRIDWQGWRLRASLHPTEGLVLHTVSCDDGGVRRSVLHRASMSEMVVPYAGTDVVHSWRAPMDVGEVGLGVNANSLTLGCDCLGEIRYLDAVMARGDGSAFTIENAICVHEEDAGILWKHTDPWTGRVDVRRSRRLVVSSISSIGNYDYGFYWYLYQDGTLQFDVRLTGVIAVRVDDGATAIDDGALVTETIVGLNHQHLFCLRLDFDIDGTENSVHEVETVRVPRGPENPLGNHFRVSDRRLERERDAQRVVDPAVGRHWVVRNPQRRGRSGIAAGYRILPGYHGVLLADPDAAIARRCGFATKNLWVTPFDPAERHAGGDYPNNHPGGEGLTAWTARDRSLVETDVVVWYTLGLTHLPRPEDWPVMPVEICSVSFKPAGFFDENPTLDVPAPDHCT
jgi:primary-amine oxidase